jgi:phage gp36-like protein
MAYTTTSDLQDAAGGAERYLELTDWNNDGTSDAAVVTRAQEDADGWVDAHLRKFSPADLAALRATPTATIRRIAAAETIALLRERRRGLATEDIELRKTRKVELEDMRADKLRPADSKTARATFVENDSDVSRDNLKGQW